jgi:hypothetical protein
MVGTSLSSIYSFIGWIVNIVGLGPLKVVDKKSINC